MSTTKREKVIENLIRVLNGKEPLPVANIPKGLKPLNELSLKIYNGELNASGSDTLPPKLYFTGDITNMSKENSKTLKIDYVDGDNSFEGYASVKWQGTSSLSYAKKNFNIKLYKDEGLKEKKKIEFNKNWGKENKYCLKANYIDHSHARNIIGANIWSEMVADRETMPQALLNSPNNGAIDGFPIMLYMNGNYEGLYTLNIPKDGWMFNMDDKNPNHAVLCSESHIGAGAFRALAQIDETDWSLEYPDTLQDDIKTSFNNMITFVKDSTDEEFKANIDTYINKEALIDYYLYCYAITALDSLGKNMIMLTYDGVQWIPSMYDMDSTWGLYWDGSKFIGSDYSCPYDYECKQSLLWERVQKCFKDELFERYTHLRKNQLSYNSILNKFERFMKNIGKELYDKDVVAYTGIPSAQTNNIYQLIQYVKLRLTRVDNRMKILCGKLSTSIADSLVFSVKGSDYNSTNGWKDTVNQKAATFTGDTAPVVENDMLIVGDNCYFSFDVTSLGLTLSSDITIEFKGDIKSWGTSSTGALSMILLGDGTYNNSDSLFSYYSEDMNKLLTAQGSNINETNTVKAFSNPSTSHFVVTFDHTTNVCRIFTKNALNDLAPKSFKAFPTTAITLLTNFEAGKTNTAKLGIDEINIYNRAVNELEALELLN